MELAPQRGVDATTWALRGGVLVCAIMLGLLLGWHLVKPKTVVRRHPVAPAQAVIHPAAVNPAPANPAAANPAPARASAKPGTPEAAPTPRSVDASSRATGNVVPPGGLQVFENGKEIFRMPPAKNEAEPNPGTGEQAAESSAADGLQRASSAEPETGDQSSAMPEGSLLRRVEPEYPADARQQKMEGTVVLDVKIGEDGGVQNVNALSGPPELADAAMNAVKQWRFKPRRINGQPSPMQTRVTLNFRLPQ